jgi:hypothetical protein
LKEDEMGGIGSMHRNDDKHDCGKKKPEGKIQTCMGR